MDEFELIRWLDVLVETGMIHRWQTMLWYPDKEAGQEPPKARCRPPGEQDSQGCGPVETPWRCHPQRDPASDRLAGSQCPGIHQRTFGKEDGLECALVQTRRRTCLFIERLNL